MMMVLFLAERYYTYRKLFPDNDPKVYFEMIASYIIYVNLFNTYCGVRMYSSWNENIGNTYVYMYESVNGQQIEMDSGQITENEVQMTFAHVCDITKKPFDKISVEFLRKINNFEDVLCCLLGYQNSNQQLSKIFGITVINESVIAISMNKIRRILFDYNESEKVQLISHCRNLIEHDSFYFRHKNIFSLFINKHDFENYCKFSGLSAIKNPDELTDYKNKLKGIISDITEIPVYNFYNYVNSRFNCKIHEELKGSIKTIIEPCLKSFFDAHKLGILNEAVSPPVSQAPPLIPQALSNTQQLPQQNSQPPEIPTAAQPVAPPPEFQAWLDANHMKVVQV